MSITNEERDAIMADIIGIQEAIKKLMMRTSVLMDIFGYDDQEIEQKFMSMRTTEPAESSAKGVITTESQSRFVPETRDDAEAKAVRLLDGYQTRCPKCDELLTDCRCLKL